MSLRNPLARAKGLGSAKDGTSHWWHQRLTAIALALLTPWFVMFAVSLIGASHARRKPCRSTSRSARTSRRLRRRPRTSASGASAGP